MRPIDATTASPVHGARVEVIRQGLNGSLCVRGERNIPLYQAADLNEEGLAKFKLIDGRNTRITVVAEGYEQAAALYSPWNRSKHGQILMLKLNPEGDSN